MGKLVGQTFDDPFGLPDFINRVRGLLGEERGYRNKYSGLHRFADEAIGSGYDDAAEGIILPNRDIMLRHGEDMYNSAGGYPKMVRMGISDFGARMYQMDEGMYRIGDPQLAEHSFPARGIRQSMLQNSNRVSPYNEELTNAIFNMQSYGMPYDDVKSYVSYIRGNAKNMPKDYKELLTDVASDFRMKTLFPNQSFRHLAINSPKIMKGPSILFGYDADRQWHNTNALVDGYQIVKDPRSVFPFDGNTNIYAAVHSPR